MSVIREENDKIIKVMSDIALHTVSGIDGFASFNLLRDKGDKVAEAILNDIYKVRLSKLLAEGDASRVKGFIRPTANSWLQMIDYGGVDLGANARGLGLVNYDTELLNKLKGRVTDELSHYKDISLDGVKRYVYKVNDFLKNSGEGEELANVVLTQLALTEAYPVLRDKGVFNAIRYVSVISDDTAHNIALSPDALSNISADLEVGIAVKDELSKDQDVVRYVADIMTTPTIALVAQNIARTSIGDINGVIALTAVLFDVVAKQTVGTFEYDVAVKLFNVAATTSLRLVASYDIIKNNKTVVYGVKRDAKDNIEIDVIKDNYQEFTTSGGTLNILIGFVYASTAQANDIGRYITINGYESELLNGKGKYEGIAEAAKNARVLTYKNESATRLRNYYIYALDAALGEDTARNYYKQVRSYVDSKSIGELIKINDMAFFIFENIVEDKSNFHEFMVGYREAESVAGKNADTEALVAYGALRLVLMYMAIQTNIE